MEIDLDNKANLRWLSRPDYYLQPQSEKYKARRGMIIAPEKSYASICGMVINDYMESLETEWRTFSDRGMVEISKKVRTGRPISLALYDMGLSMQISYSNVDAKGDTINPTQTPIIKRIRRWDKISSL